MPLSDIMNNNWVHEYLESMYPDISNNCDEPIVMDEYPYSEYQFTMPTNSEDKIVIEKTPVMIEQTNHLW